MELYVKIRRAVMVEGKSEREVARYFGVHRQTVKKMCQYAIPPGYRRRSAPASQSGEGCELGCISIQELIENGVELGRLRLLVRLKRKIRKVNWIRLTTWL